MSSVYLKCCLSISGFSTDFIPANLSCNNSGDKNKQSFFSPMNFTKKNKAIELKKNDLKLNYYENF